MPSSIQDPGAKLKMLGADRVVQRVYPTRDVPDTLAERRTIKDLGKGGLGGRRGQNIEECAIKDVAMLLAQIIDCQLTALRFTIGHGVWFSQLWSHLGKRLVYYLMMSCARWWLIEITGRWRNTGMGAVIVHTYVP